MKTSEKTKMSIDEKILKAIKKQGKGAVFVPSDFLELGSREAIDVALFRLTKEKTIRRLARGVYNLPKVHPVLGPLQPSVEQIATALAARDQSRLQPTGALAANLLGLSDQVPAKSVFLTDGLSRKVKIGSSTIELRQTTPRNMAAAGRLSGLLIQAFRELGKEHITPARIKHLKKTIPLSKRKTIIKDMRLAPVWMHPIFKELAEQDK